MLFFFFWKFNFEIPETSPLINALICFYTSIKNRIEDCALVQKKKNWTIIEFIFFILRYKHSIMLITILKLLIKLLNN